MAFRVRKQKAVNAYARLTCSVVFSLEPQLKDLGPPREKMGHLSSADLVWIIPQRHTQRLVSAVGFSPINLVISTNITVLRMFSHEGDLRRVDQVGSMPVMLQRRHRVECDGAQGTISLGAPLSRMCFCPLTDPISDVSVAAQSLRDVQTLSNDQRKTYFYL